MQHHSKLRYDNPEQNCIPIALISRHYWPIAGTPPLHISRTRTGIWMLATCCPVIHSHETNKSFIAWWNNKTEKQVKLYGGLHSDIYNVPTQLLRGFRKEQINLTKAKRDFYLMNKDAGYNVIFKFLEVQLLVKRVRSTPAYLLTDNTTLQGATIPKYYLTRVEHKSFTFSSVSQSFL